MAQTQSKDYYDVMGVQETATQDEIQQAFRTLARIYHPDMPTGDADKFREIGEANAVLSVPEKRREYDRMQNEAPVRDLRANLRVKVESYLQNLDI